MKPLAPVSGLSFPLALGLSGLPLCIEAPVWGAAVSAAAAGWGYAAWRREIDLRPPLPALAGEAYEPLDVSIAWRTATGEFPVLRRGWRATLTPEDLWLSAIRPSRLLGGDRDHVRIPRLDVVGCELASDTELRVRFLDDEGRAQEARLTHVPNAAALAAALGHEAGRGSRIVDLGSPE